MVYFLLEELTIHRRQISVQLSVVTTLRLPSYFKHVLITGTQKGLQSTVFSVIFRVRSFFTSIRKHAVRSAFAIKALPETGPLQCLQIQSAPFARTVDEHSATASVTDNPTHYVAHCYHTVTIPTPIVRRPRHPHIVT